MESSQATVQDYYLWNWRNESSDKEIDYIDLIPGELPVLIAALTLSNVDENPFARSGKRPVKIEVNSNELKEIPGETLEIEVDTGVSTYPHSLPEVSSDKFIDDKFKGWGERENSVSKSSYVDIAATNSADIKVKQNGTEVGSVSWKKLLKDKTSKSDKIDFKLIEDGKNWVHVKVIDDETNKIVPCRVHFRSPDGVPYQPHGHHNQVNTNLETWHIDIGGDVRLGRVTYAYIDGTSQGWLPRGEVIVDIARGFEYEPLRIKEFIKPGQRELNLRLKRWTNMNKKNWYSGDSHVHFLGTQGAHTHSYNTASWDNQSDYTGPYVQGGSNQGSRNTNSGGGHSHNFNITADTLGISANHTHSGNTSPPLTTSEHNHGVSGNSGSGGSHSHNVSISGNTGSNGSGGSGANKPKYYALYYIMKT